MNDLFDSEEEKQLELNKLARRIQQAWWDNGCKPASLEKIRADLDRECFRADIVAHLLGL